MPTEDERLTGEVAIVAAIEGTGIKVAGRSRALTGADRLLGNLLDIPGSYVEELRNRVLLRQKSKTVQAKVEEATKLAELAELAGLPALQQLGLENLVRDGARKQENREAVWVHTEEALKALPPPEVGAEPEAPDNLDEPLDEDWLNVFARHAEDASTERVQEMWGRILAGEIRKPRSFSISTLRVISELDAEIATAFQELAPLRIRTNIWRGALPDSRKGQALVRLSMLEDAGLLQEVGGHRQLQFQPGGNDIPVIGERHALVLSPVTAQLNVEVIPLTRAGAEIAAILPIDEVALLTRVAESLPQFENAYIARIVSRTESGVRLIKIKQLRGAET